jgi:hypothetical protein
VNRPANITGATDHAVPHPRRGGAPNAAPIQIDAAVSLNAARNPTGETGASNLSTNSISATSPVLATHSPDAEAGRADDLRTYSRCPDCDGPFSYRIRDDDTRCSYPVDDGEHYCAQCDSLWTDEYLAGSLAPGWERVEL